MNESDFLEVIKLVQNMSSWLLLALHLCLGDVGESAKECWGELSDVWVCQSRISQALRLFGEPGRWGKARSEKRAWEGLGGCWAPVADRGTLGPEPCTRCQAKTVRSSRHQRPSVPSRCTGDKQLQPSPDLTKVMPVL